jgi:uncharacterized protein YbjT (DUF2867 family)
MKVLVTGANGHLGRGLIARLVETDADSVRAVVRSERAADQVAAVADVDTRILDYTDEAALAEAARGCSAAVHFVGIIKETKEASYADAHEATCAALANASAASGIERIVYLSIFGSRPDSPNSCLASKGRAEQILLGATTAACVLRVPMVLGPGDFASYSLRNQATRGVVPMIGAGRTLQQPIDSRDVIRAVLAALECASPIDGALDLGGPECLPHRELVARAAALHGKRPTVLPIPLALARAAVALLERLSANPPMTTAMFDVLQHDDRLDTAPACKQLDLELTPLDDTLRATVGPEHDSR